jgi:hypothetical protein
VLAHAAFASQLSTDFGPDLQNALHETVVPSLIAVMDDAANPRVQSHAAAAVINFTENCRCCAGRACSGTGLTPPIFAPGRIPPLPRQSVPGVSGLTPGGICSKEIIKPYLDALLSKLVVLLQNGTRIVQEQVGCNTIQ